MTKVEAGEHARLVAETITLAYGREPVVDSVTLRLPPGRTTVLLGPNGSGKSTLLRGLVRLLAPRAGAALLDGRALARWPHRELARQLGHLPQMPEAPGELTVRELVELGRYPHVGLWKSEGKRDRDAVDAALAQASVDDLQHRPVQTLSGGQRQRAWIAMALAQETPILLLDEPTTSLDPAHQLEVLELLDRLRDELGRTLVLVLHDLNHAARHGDHLVALKGGRIVAEGAPTEVLTTDIIREVFHVEVDVLTHARTGKLLCVPWSRSAP